MIWKVRACEIPLNKTLIMGILNLTPDSFSDGGKFLVPEKALLHARALVREGADILDLGAESTRPFAVPVSVEEELNRLLPVLHILNKELNVPISIDTTKPEVARKCLSEGAHIINDVSGLKDSGPKMAEAIRDFHAGLVLMHRRGNPQTMQTLTHYEDVIEEILNELRSSIRLALGSGIELRQLVIDPGLGFAKTADQNLEIISHLEKFHNLELPVLIGPSRKSFIGKVTGREIGEREYGTAAISALAVMKNIQILRVHETGPARDVVRTVEAVRNQEAQRVRSL